MHPEVVSDKPGKCPKCGMFLVERETAAGRHADHGRSETAQPAPSSDDDSSHDRLAAERAYTCPMHPEVISDQPGSCPKCGMDLIPADAHEGHGGHGSGGGQHHHEHSGHASHSGHRSGETIPGIEPHFMSMVELTEGKPVSPDGLIMEWITVPFGPFFPGLPGGLVLEFTLDGDSVADTRIQGNGAMPVPPGSAPVSLPDRLAASCPLAPVAMRELACRALESAALAAPAPAIATARAAAVERERIASHLNWLTGFAHQTGLTWLERRAAAMHHRLRDAGADEIGRDAAAVCAFLRRVRATPLLALKLKGIGKLDSAQGGPAARAAGLVEDARCDDPAYAELGFSAVVGDGGDALARLQQRCVEIEQSLDLIARAGTIALPYPPDDIPSDGHGMATVETPRGPATLHLMLKDSVVETARLTTPFAALAERVPAMGAQVELADALVAIGSLDLDLWGAAQ
ncbi:heavy metal-binding domain-containing protein [Nitratireductor sp. L15S-10]|uniref:heavy metal-binding domain-containing protein n=1 Tax=Nitratireductor TaxID=245876 RepID=UPI0038579074